MRKIWVSKSGVLSHFFMGGISFMLKGTKHKFLSQLFHFLKNDQIPCNAVQGVHGNEYLSLPTTCLLRLWYILIINTPIGFVWIYLKATRKASNHSPYPKLFAFFSPAKLHCIKVYKPITSNDWGLEYKQRQSNIETNISTLEDEQNYWHHCPHQANTIWAAGFNQRTLEAIAPI